MARSQGLRLRAPVRDTLLLRRTRSSFAMSCVSALVVILLAEMGARSVQHSFPDPVEWYDAKAQVKVEQMERLGRRRKIDVIFAGTSMVFRGVNPKVFDEAAEPKTLSYNAALLGAVPPVMERWVLEEVEPRLKPKTVIYGLSTIDFHERRYKRPVKSYENASATSKGWMASLERVAAGKLNLVRFRSLLRDPKAWKEPPKGLRNKEGPVEKAREVVDDRGHAPKKKVERGGRERSRIRDVLKRYEVSGRGTKSLERTVQTLKKRGVDVILVFMPVPGDYGPLHPNGRHDVKVTRRHVMELGDMWEVPAIDMSKTMPDRYFVDFTHLNDEGADLYSKKLRKQVERLDQ